MSTHFLLPAESTFAFFQLTFLPMAARPEDIYVMDLKTIIPPTFHNLSEEG